MKRQGDREKGRRDDVGTMEVGGGRWEVIGKAEEMPMPTDSSREEP